VPLYIATPRLVVVCSYLNSAPVLRDSSERFSEVTQALNDIGFTPEEHGMLQHVLAAVLHLGQIAFTSAVSSWKGAKSRPDVYGTGCTRPGCTG
jgi:myosin heavy subunit